MSQYDCMGIQRDAMPEAIDVPVDIRFVNQYDQKEMRNGCYKVRHCMYLKRVVVLADISVRSPRTIYFYYQKVYL